MQWSRGTALSVGFPTPLDENFTNPMSVGPPNECATDTSSVQICGAGETEVPFGLKKKTAVATYLVAWLPNPPLKPTPPPQGEGHAGVK